MTPEHLQQLLDEWPLYFKKLSLFANHRLRQRYWRGEQSAFVPGGYEPEDIAEEAILDVVEGRRQWNPKEEPDLLRFLFGVVNSKISNLSNKTENKIERRVEEDVVESVASKSAPPTTALEDGDFILGFMEYLEDDRELSDVVDCLISGCMERAAIADRLSVSPDEITNRKKRLKRKTNDYIEQARTIRRPTA